MIYVRVVNVRTTWGLMGSSGSSKEQVRVLVIHISLNQTEKFITKQIVRNVHGIKRIVY